MPSYYWIKLWLDLLNDPKMGTLPDRLWRRAIELFLVARTGVGDGYLPDLEDVAWSLRLSSEELIEDLMALENRTGIIRLREDGWYVTNFAKRQEPASSTKRSQKHREEKGKKELSWRMKLYINLPERPGAYRIICAANGASYTGISKNVKNRVKAHLTDIKTQGHPLYHEFTEYGSDDLRVEVLELAANESQLRALEQKWLDRRDELSRNREARSKPHRDWNCNEKGTNSSLEAEAEADVQTTEVEVDEQQTTDSEAVAAVVLDLKTLNLLDPKATELATMYATTGKLDHLLPDVRAGIAHYATRPGITNPMGLIVTQLLAGNAPIPPPSHLCPTCHVAPCHCAEFEEVGR